MFWFWTVIRSCFWVFGLSVQCDFLQCPSIFFKVFVFTRGSFLYTIKEMLIVDYVLYISQWIYSHALFSNLSQLDVHKFLLYDKGSSSFRTFFTIHFKSMNEWIDWYLCLFLGHYTIIISHSQTFCISQTFCSLLYLFCVPTVGCCALRGL